MKKVFRLLTPVLVIAAAVGVSVTLSVAKPQAETVDNTPRPLSLRVERVSRERVVLNVDTQGEVQPVTDVTLVPEVSGRIVAVNEGFRVGGGFAAGETLIQIDPANYKLAVIRAEARVAEAKVALEQELADARIKQKQWKDWVADGEPTPLALNKPQVAEAQAKLRAAEADLQEARLNLERTKISLPFDGRITERSVGPGQFVSIGSTLGRVFSTEIVEVTLPLTDRQLGELNLPIGYLAADAKGAPQVTLSANLGGQSHQWRGQITRVHADVNNQTRLISASVEVRDPYKSGADGAMPLAVGLFVNAQIEGIAETDALVMPRNALRGADQVFVVSKSDKLEIRTVELIATDADRVLVKSGLREGDLVVTSPVRAAVDGMAVQPIVRAAQDGARAALSSR